MRIGGTQLNGIENVNSIKENSKIISIQITKEKYGRLDLNINVAGIGLAARTWNFKQNKFKET